MIKCIAEPHIQSATVHLRFNFGQPVTAAAVGEA